MKISKIYVSNFKSLVDFEIELADFNCLIGLNGAGKSTFLQFVSFLSQLMRGDLDGWLSRRTWKASDICTACFKQAVDDKNVAKPNGSNKPQKFRITFLDNSGNEGYWESEFNIGNKRCFNEKFSIAGSCFQTRYNKESQKRFYRVSNAVGGKNVRKNINFQYDGSIFSRLDDKEVPDVFYQFRQYILNVESMDQLAPQYLRNRARASFGSIGQSGEHLSALLSEFDEDNRRAINMQLQKVYPHLRSFDVKGLRSGWKQLEVKEHYGQWQMTTESRHVNDGMLRLLAILSQLQTNYRFLLFDEIENGINPELIGFLLATLIGSSRQVVTTTHSPMILNYLDDETATAGVHLIYKTSEGCSQCVRFLSIPSMAEKLEVMGPGEVFIDTNLVALSEEIEGELMEKREDR